MEESLLLNGANSWSHPGVAQEAFSLWKLLDLFPEHHGKPGLVIAYLLEAQPCGARCHLCIDLSGGRDVTSQEARDDVCQACSLRGSLLPERKYNHCWLKLSSVLPAPITAHWKTCNHSINSCPHTVTSMLHTASCVTRKDFSSFSVFHNYSRYVIIS